MQEMIDAIRASVAVASRAGMSQARIALHPAELGEIRIHLSQTSAGILARVTAGTEEAARGLLDGRGELHRALSTLGVPLLGLDVGSSGDGTAGQRGTAGQALSQPGVQTSAGGGGEDDASGAADIQKAQPASGLSDGGLVNVLA
jgi:flagellar hook-length control protein FliK